VATVSLNAHMHFAADGQQLEYYHYKEINLDAQLRDTLCIGVY
jgi:hypothetical protein